MIETQALTKAFGLKPVLRGVDLSLAPGELAVLMGPNGAGKTTLLRILSTLMRPSRGRVQVGGFPLPAAAGEVRRRLGVVAHHPLLYGDLTAEENLRFYARLYGLRDSAPRITQVLNQVGLHKRRRDPVRTYSRGMQQRLALARAILHAPDVLLLDEPYTGLDQEASVILDNLLRDFVAQGRTILLTIHDLRHGLELADRVLILAHGKIAFSAKRSEINPDEFLRTYAALLKA